MVPSTAAFAEQDKPGVSSYAWYWESQSSQAVTDPTSGADVVTIEAPNPFCPSTSVGGPPQEAGACHAGRLPIQVQGADYETPEMISAVAFDLALVPIGSTVTSMKATFLEANDEQSEPLNAEGKQLQACVVEQFFGDGDARQYEEAPRFTCSETDPIADRKEIEVKNADGETETRFAWTFDLTSLASQWVSLDGGLPVSAIMLFPVEPEEADPAADTNWRVVLTGPADAEENGIKSSITFEPPEVPDFGDPTDTTTTPTDTSTTFTPPSSTGLPTTTTPTTTSTAPPVADTPLDLAGNSETLADELGTTAGALPGYVWLAILAGLIGFSLVRSVVIESATGVRPDGVLSHIQKINSERRGVSMEEALEVSSHSRFAALTGGARRLAGGARSIASKLPFPRKKV